MGAIRDGGPAFPRPVQRDPLQQHELLDEGAFGMSLRDYFAAMAMHGAADSICDLVSSGERTIDGIPAADVMAGELERHAKAAYLVADAMLKAREEGR